MFFSKFGKYWLVYFTSLVYTFVCHYFPHLVSWETPNHIVIIINIILTIGSVFMGGMILSCLAEDMMGRKESFGMFGNKKLWRTWQYIGLPMMIWGLYKWDHVGIILASIVFYFGMKCIITNHNKHVDEFNKEEMIRRARQETAEKVTL